MEEISMRLRKLRERLKLSVRALSRMTGISRQTILDYELGKYSPGKAYWEVLKNILRIKSSYKDFWKRDPQGVGRPRLYDDMTCAYTNCEERPASKGLCPKHYMHDRRKAR